MLPPAESGRGGPSESFCTPPIYSHTCLAVSRAPCHPLPPHCHSVTPRARVPRAAPLWGFLTDRAPRHPAPAFPPQPGLPQAWDLTGYCNIVAE